jgi:hypothetical protein
VFAGGVVLDGAVAEDGEAGDGVVGGVVGGVVEAASPFFAEAGSGADCDGLLLVGVCCG